MKKNNIYINHQKLPLKPILKWVGGKKQIFNEINKRLPKTFNTYFEPFIGGGYLLFALQPKEAYINDLNKELINLYKIVKTNPNEFINNLLTFKNRSKWSVMNKYQRILMVCWKLTENQSFEISKKQIAEICDCNQKYVEHLFLNSEHIRRKTKKNLVFECFETIKKTKNNNEFFVPLSEKFFISRRQKFNGLDVFWELKDFLSAKEKHILKSRVENID